MTEKQRIIRDYYEQSYTNKQDNLKERDKFLETYDLPRRNHDRVENLNRPITGKDIEPKTSQQMKVQEQMASLVKFTNIQRRFNSYISQTLPKN